MLAVCFNTFNLHPIVFFVLESTFHVPYYYAMTPYFCWKHRRKNKTVLDQSQAKNLMTGPRWLAVHVDVGEMGCTTSCWILPDADLCLWWWVSMLCFFHPEKLGEDKTPKIDGCFLCFFQMGWKYTVYQPPGTRNIPFKVVVSIKWFQTFTWEMVVSPNIH